MTDVGLEKETLESRKQTVHRHTSWSLQLPSKGRMDHNIFLHGIDQHPFISTIIIDQ